MKKIIFIFSVFILGSYLLWRGMLPPKENSRAKQKNINATHKSNYIPLQNEKIAHKKILAEGFNFCPELEKVITHKDKITDSHTFAHNIHFKKGNAVHRIRVFTEDGDEGSFEKLIYYIEDQDGFPQIKPIDAHKRINPSEDYILSLLHGTQTIYDSLDVTYYLSSGKSFNASYVNGKITKVTAAQVNCEI